MLNQGFWIAVLVISLLLLLSYFIFRWRPKKNVWYRNSIKEFNLGHLVYIKNCYIIFHGKKSRGSFKVVGKKVIFMYGYKFHREGIRTIDKSRCTFHRYRMHTGLQGQGTHEEFVTTYVLVIK